MTAAINVAGQVRRHRLLMDDGARTYAESFGPSRADVTVVLAHGWCLDSSSWDDVTRLLLDKAPHVRVVRYDQRAHGRSRDARPGAGRMTPSVKRLGADLLHLLEHLAPEGRLVLAGHSMGGMTIMAAAGMELSLLERTAGVALVSTSADTTKAHLPLLPDAVPMHWQGPLLAAGMKALSSLPRLPEVVSDLVPPSLRALSPRVALGADGTRRLLFGRDATPEAVRAAHAMIGRTALSTVGGYFAHALATHDEREALSSLASVPTKVIVGELDRLTPVEHSHALADAIQGAELITLEGIGHMLPMEKPDAVTNVLLELVASR
jgi:pimeloyl-ACP methyl ester carboxylesterase